MVPPLPPHEGANHQEKTNIQSHPQHHQAQVFPGCQICSRIVGWLEFHTSDKGWEGQNWSGGENYKIDLVRITSKFSSQSGDPLSCCFLHLPFSWANNIWSEICDQLLLWYFLSEMVWRKTFFLARMKWYFCIRTPIWPRRNKCELINAFTANAKCIQLDIST